VERSHIITSGERGKIVYYWDSSLFSKAVSVPSPTGVAEGKTALTCVSDAITQAGTDMLPTDTVTDVPTSAAGTSSGSGRMPDRARYRKSSTAIPAQRLRQKLRALRSGRL
jgi:hypothetical protein